MELKYKNSLAVIIPMYNEEATASKCIDKVVEEIKKLKLKSTLMIINDGSKDSTLKILTEKKKIYKNKLIIINKKNGGYGSALRLGIKKAIELKFEYYLTMDSDLTNPPKYIPKLISALKNGADCVKASRYIKGGKMVNVPYYRQIISIIGNYFAKLAFNVGINDCTNGFKIVKLSYLKNINFKENNFSIILEELYYLKKAGAKFAEVPNILYCRTNSKSHFNYTPKIFYDYFKYALLAIFIR